MSERKIISTYKHCGYKQEIEAIEVEGFFGQRVSIVHSDGTTLNLNPQQANDLEQYFIERAEGREKAAAALAAEVNADPDPEDYPEDDEDAEEWGEETNDLVPTF